MIKLIFTDTDTRRYLFLLVSVLVGITVGYLTLPFIVDHHILPEVHKNQTETESHYIGYGVEEDQSYSIYATEEDEKQDHKNMISSLYLQILIGTAAFFVSCFIFIMIELIIYVLSDHRV